ncbi:MAG: DUF1573 domain-containing protein [Bacteroidales bacterium]|nr:DUF1573 domain-containing protein [Bacteroidales bacterium]
MKFLLAILVSLFCTVGTSAQPSIVFDTLEYDFGEIGELAGIVQYRFVYKNTGNKPLIINSVHTSCGCTSPAWSKEPILPSMSGYIDVSFDPRDRPGMFTKSIVINCNATEKSVTLYIMGNVIPRPEPLSSTYPYQMMDLRLKATTVNYSKVIAGQTVTKEIEVVNPSKANIVIAPDVHNMPPYMQIIAKPSILKPGEKGVIKCVLNTVKLDMYDMVQFDVPVLINEAFSYNLHAKAIVSEHFTDKDKKNAPVFTLDGEAVADLGEMEAGEVKIHRISYRNTGSTPLKIRAVRNACDCISVRIDTPEVAPGQDGSITIVFNTEGRTGKQNRYLTIITNSAVSQQVVYRLTGTIK